MKILTSRNDMKNDDDIRARFIVEEDVSQHTAEELARRALKFGRVAKDGSVILNDSELSKADQLKLALVIRYIGNCLDETILRIVRPFELTRTLGQRLEAVGAGMSKLAAEGFVKKGGRGEYTVYPYRAEAFLDYLEKQEGADENSKPRKSTRSSQGKTSQPLSGIGLHIQKIIDDGFFETPRLISEVTARLAEENIFRDGRVIDKTMRETFVQHRRVLQRVTNTTGGGAKWRYVVRK